jgi:hypothetical protein
MRRSRPNADTKAKLSPIGDWGYVPRCDGRAMFQHTVWGICAATLLLWGCAKEEQTTAPPTGQAQEYTLRNLWVDTARGFALLDFERGNTVSAELRGTEQWDLWLPALSARSRSIDIFLNSGTFNPAGKTLGAVVNVPYDQLTTVPTAELRAEDTVAARRIISPSLGGDGLFVYDFQTHVLKPVPTKTLVLKTRTGKYVKVQFVSLYKDAPAQPNPYDLGYYTIRYTISTTPNFR